MIKIYLANACTLKEVSEIAYAKLTDYRKKKTDKLHVEMPRLTSIMAGLLLNYATKDYLNCKLEDDKSCAIKKLATEDLIDGYDTDYDFEIEEIGQGKPVYKERTDIHFNISHTANIVVVAIASKPIGIDIDGNRNFSDRMIDKFYSKKEAAWVYGNDLTKQDRFFSLWTMKEAFSKLLGDGIARTILNVEFLHDTDIVECYYKGEKQDVIIEEQEYCGYKIAVIREA
ncbi:4'-phosphopantetheinyl transferase family protein [Lachnospira sp.]|jgi:4'-phosphopantetheinyl transferase|uniref:4'-phosphopantetheinyl transferase family protein n=1 Tax=Lachnospira sp. TaxID=2049031 RepID=UPI00257DB3ED|nr:4'-phosphopantetheinyl transferase superfamily protein [Lachnospira sp.]